MGLLKDIASGIGKAASFISNPLGGIVGAFTGGKSPGEWLGNTAGNYVAGKLGNKLDRESSQDQYGFLRSQGLTPQEIVGGSMPGQAGSSGNVLGNNYSAQVLQAKQQSYDHLQRQLDRQVAMRGQDTSMQNARTSAGAAIYASDNSRRTATERISLDRDRFRNIDLPVGLNRILTTTPEWERTRIMAQMGVDNILGTAIANEFGVDPFDKESLSRLSQSEFREMVRRIYGYQSNVFGETAGASTVIGEGASEGAKDLKGLGNRFLGLFQ